MAISSIFSRMWDTPARPLASAMSWARPTSSSAWCTMAVMPPSRSHRPREWAKTAALAASPSRKTRSSGTNTSSNTTNPSGMLIWLLTGKSRVSSPFGWYVVLMMRTPGELTGTAQVIA
jgi:hypothetical protein